MSAWQQLLDGPLVALTITVACFEFGAIIYRRSGHRPWLHPTFCGAGAVAAVLWLLDIDYHDYNAGVEILSLLLGTVTVALAVPLYRQLALIRQVALPVLIATLGGATFAVLTAAGLTCLFGASEQTLLSLLPKSISTPIAIGVSQELGGLVELTTGTVMLTAVVGISTAPLLYRWCGIRDPRVQGFALGVAAHAMGTARAFEAGPVAGAFASLGLCLTGIVTAVLLPSLAGLFL